jgi:hypothetical protein
MMTGRNRSMVLSAMAIAMLMPAAGTAAVSGEPVNVERARQLRAQAEALFDQPREWNRAAKLLEQSAALRAADDAEAYSCLIAAGRIRAALRDHDAATRLLGKAGDQALARGAVMDAALAYVFAAHSGMSAGDVANAKAYGEKARLLTASPLLTAAQRADVLSRIS